MQSDTHAIHGRLHGSGKQSLVAPIAMSTSFDIDPSTSFSADLNDPAADYIYTRWGNPSVQELEEKVALLEGGEDAVALASGMAAVTGLLLSLLKAGDHIITSNVMYAGVREFCHDDLVRFGVSVSAVDTSNVEAIAEQIRKETKLILIETPCNPILRLSDIRAIATLAQQERIPLAVDSTFATPVLTQPLSLGADYVIHSLTKYMGGHGDAIGGIVVGKRDAITHLKQKANIKIGSIISPFNAWLINRGIKTLPLRMQRHSDNALKVATFLEDHPKVKQVIYPFLSSHPQYGLARRQMKMGGGMLGFQLKDSHRNLPLDRLSFIRYAVSLGHDKTLFCFMPTDELMESSFHLSGEEQQQYRNFAGDGFFRMSVGLESAADICEELNRLLA